MHAGGWEFGVGEAEMHRGKQELSTETLPSRDRGFRQSEFG